MTLSVSFSEREARAIANAAALLDAACHNHIPDRHDHDSPLRTGVDKLNYALIEAGLECGDTGLLTRVEDEGSEA